MVEANPQKRLLRDSGRLLWRSFKAAVVVGSLGGGGIMVLEALNVAVEHSDLSTLAVAPILIGYGLVFGMIFWIPAWAVTVVFALAWLWTAGDLGLRARYVLALVASIALYILTDAGVQDSDWATPLPLLSAVLAAIGVWAAVPWVLKPPHADD